MPPGGHDAPRGQPGPACSGRAAQDRRLPIEHDAQARDAVARLRPRDDFDPAPRRQAQARPRPRLRPEDQRAVAARGRVADHVARAAGDLHALALDTRRRRGSGGHCRARGREDRDGGHQWQGQRTALPRWVSGKEAHDARATAYERGARRRPRRGQDRGPRRAAQERPRARYPISREVMRSPRARRRVLSGPFTRAVVLPARQDDCRIRSAARPRCAPSRPGSRARTTSRSDRAG